MRSAALVTTLPFIAGLSLVFLSPLAPAQAAQKTERVSGTRAKGDPEKKADTEKKAADTEKKAADTEKKAADTEKQAEPEKPAEAGKPDAGKKESTPSTPGREEYVIQPEDSLSIRVTGEPALSTTYKLDEHGEIVMDMIGKVKLAGLTARQSEELLTRELSRFLKLFEVKVFPLGETGGKVLVYGEVFRQGSTRIRVGARLLDVLADVGGPKADADTKRISVSRKAGGKPEILDLDEVLKQPEKNVPIFTGDTITVPGKNVRSVRVDGEVRTPGLKSLEDARTAYAALRLAGPNSTADWSRVIIRKRNSSLPISLDLTKVRSGQLKDDFELEEGDEITLMSKFLGTARLAGEVKSPGEKDLNGATSVWDFILTAGGGLAERADRRKIQLIRDNKTTMVDLTMIIDGRRRSDDPTLEIQPGDVVFVPIGLATLRGQVKTQGERPLGTTTQALDFILTAGGGFTEKSDRSKVQIIREGKLFRTLDLSESALEKSSDDANFELNSGDIIQVNNDEKNRFAIVGGVKKPGSYPVSAERLTLLDAIAQAEGFSERAAKKQIVVAPSGTSNAQADPKATAKPEEKSKKKAKDEDELRAMGLVVVDYKKLLNGDPTQNVSIRPGDRILIPELPPPDSRVRRPSFLESVMRMLPLASLLMGSPGYYGGYGGYGYGY